MKEEKTTVPEKLQQGPFYPTPEVAMKAVKVSPVYKQISESLTSFEKKAKEILKQGKIEDDISAKAADSLLAEINAYVRELTKKGEAVRAPYTATAKSIKAVFDELGEMVANSNKNLRDLLQNYIKEKEEKKRKEALALEEEQKTLQAWIKQATGEILGAITPEEVVAMGTKWIKPFKKELFTKIPEDVVENALSSIKKLGRDRIEYLKNKDVSDPNTEEVDPVNTVDAIAEITESIKEATTDAMIPAMEVKFNTKLTKKLSWKMWKTVDEVDKSLLVVDPAAVQKFMRENADSIKAGLDSGKPGQNLSVVKKGIMFYYEEGTKVG